MSEASSLTQKSVLFGAIAVLGASVGAVKTAYSDDTPLELTETQMDQVTAGAPPSWTRTADSGVTAMTFEGTTLEMTMTMDAIQKKITPVDSLRPVAVDDDGTMTMTIQLGGGTR
jgi:hypothetical protein